MAILSAQSKNIGLESVHEEYTARGQPEKAGGESLSNEIDLLANNLEYVDEEHQPKFHLRTYVVLLALCLQSFCQLWSLLGPTSALSTIIAQLPGGPANQAWVVTALVIPQGVFCNIASQYSDLFQARKNLLVGCTTFAFIGSAIAPGAQTVGRLIAAQTLIGVAYVCVPLTFAVPSEILPMKWRPMVQALLQATGAFGMIAAPLSIGALTKRDLNNGWRNFYWISTGLWGASALSLFLGYRPPKRHTRLDHLSAWHKFRQMDLLGALLLGSGLCLLLAGVNMGGSVYPWTSATVLSTMLSGIALLILFGVWEWKGTKTGIMHHELFTHSRSLSTFCICVALVFSEGVLVYAFIVFYPLLTKVVFEADILKAAARVIIYYASAGIGTIIFGIMCVKLRSIRESLVIGFGAALIGLIGMATVQPGQNANPMVFAAFGGLGTAAVLTQGIAGVQVASQHSHLSAATAVAIVARAISGTVFTSIYTSVVTQKLANYLPTYITKAAIAAGLPAASIPLFVRALAADEIEDLARVAGVTPSIIAAGITALKQAYADAIRYTFIIAAPFVLVSMIGCWWLGDIKKIMTYHVDAPVEKLQPKDGHRQDEGAGAA
ncbi:uncharacterized protein Z520_06792 [Fonsecaea multimorphosa CBS 102226]|uniref:Major facilitator superfamily (MFS) profile domain-containing protein n=1 Tax=Fonsecaea multimorphosa CBS 102226 TaxID=1442371 RepID=A0A0D2H670_9EURO|nr:uncharacterized protein Z520_06792 [Fonsecaea multimorphosa CBS 102226]KIX97340.1 hypothetical protein Z520_06792 [Fonsecaea multimorphosa CBS 102226]